MFADRRVDSERHGHVHVIADNETDHRVRAVHGPGETLLLGHLEEHVLLRVVEVRPRQAWAAFEKRRVGRNFGVVVE
jgi:hypothetical protein